MRYSVLLGFILFMTSVAGQTVSTEIYNIQANDTLRMDIYRPAQSTIEVLPVVLWMHGGGFSVGRRDSPDEVKLAHYATSKGYSFVSISYRLSRKDEETGFGCNCPAQEKMETFEFAVEDYLDAALYLVNHADRLHIDKSQIIAGGSSAGAEGILHAVFMRNYCTQADPKYKNIHFAGLISLAGAVVDANYIQKENVIPAVLFHGTDDNLVPYGTAPHHYCSPESPGYLFLDGSDTIARQYNNLGASYYFYSVQGGKHEIAAIPFEELDNIFDFFNQTVVAENKIQIKKIIHEN